MTPRWQSASVVRGPSLLLSAGVLLLLLLLLHPWHPLPRGDAESARLSGVKS